MGSQWRETSLDDAAWRPTPGLSKAARAAEQDQAAGGRDFRLVPHAGRHVLASLYFRRATGRRVYGYLRWSDAGRTSEQFVCEANHETRATNLAHAWTVVRDKNLLSQPPTGGGKPSWASSDAVRKQMQANRSRDTRPELELRSRLHELGLRYRVSARPVPSVRRTADLVFTRAKVAVFVDGCFWHGCPDHYRPARVNKEFWQNKIQGNRQRDAETDKLLENAHWTVVRVWEHEQPETAALRVQEIVISQRTKSRGTTASLDQARIHQ